MEVVFLVILFHLVALCACASCGGQNRILQHFSSVCVALLQLLSHSKLDRTTLYLNVRKNSSSDFRVMLILFIYVPKSSLDTEVSAPVLADWFSNSGLQIGFVQQLEHHFFPPVARSVVES